MTTATASRREPANTTERDSADVCITLLGGFAVTVDGVRLDDGEWRRRQAAALVKILALASGRTLHREQLVDMLWPNLSVEESAPRLHKAAHFARRALHDPESVILAGDAVRLFPTRRVRVDAIQFETLAVSALAAADRGAASRAADTYTGELLPQDPYEDWAIDTRDRMHLLYLDVLRLGRRWQLLAAADPTRRAGPSRPHRRDDAAGRSSLRAAPVRKTRACAAPRTRRDAERPSNESAR
jgi:two-component SAPR family response regulator